MAAPSVAKKDRRRTDTAELPSPSPSEVKCILIKFSSGSVLENENLVGFPVWMEQQKGCSMTWCGLNGYTAHPSKVF